MQREQLAQELEAKVKKKQGKVVRWDDSNNNPPEQQKKSPLALTPNKPCMFRALLDFSFLRQVTERGTLDDSPRIIEGQRLRAPLGFSVIDRDIKEGGEVGHGGLTWQRGECPSNAYAHTRFAVGVHVRWYFLVFLTHRFRRWAAGGAPLSRNKSERNWRLLLREYQDFSGCVPCHNLLRDEQV